MLAQVMQTSTRFGLLFISIHLEYNLLKKNPPVEKELSVEKLLSKLTFGEDLNQPIDSMSALPDILEFCKLGCCETHTHTHTRPECIKIKKAGTKLSRSSFNVMS